MATRSENPNDDVERKAFASDFEIKDEATGQIESVIATYGVIDHDGDIVQKGAIPEGTVVAISEYGHSAIFGDAPVGKGSIAVDGNRVIMKGQLFMDMPEARKTLAVLKGMGKDQQWSWGFRVLGAETPSDDQRKQGAYRIITKTDTFEASPVLRGAGIGTRTLSAKAADLEPQPEPKAPDPDPTLLETSTGWQPRTGNEKSSDDLARELRIAHTRARLGL